MKTFLRTAFLMVLGFTAGKTSFAQCTASDLVIQNVVPVGIQTPGSCSATFDLSFTMQNNNGNKFIFLHVWAQSEYPDFFNCVDGNPGGNGALQPPAGSDLADAFINIGINNDGAIPVLLTAYPPDGSVTLNSALSVTSSVNLDGSVSFVLHGVTATFPVDCNTPFLMTADLWSSQAAAGQVVQCVNCNINFAINFLSISGFANCANLTYATLATNLIGSALNGYFQVYADADHDGVLSIGSDSLIRDTSTFTLAAGVGSTFLMVGTIPSVNINQDLFIVITITSGVGSGSKIITKVLTTVCAPLPVNFGSFAASRINSTRVTLRWETYTEVNNNGFAIERNMGDGIWQTIGFVPTQSADGSSNSLLVYTFNDLNNNKGITQYRIRQVDIDNRSKYSEIRAVRGYNQNGDLIVYPNPSSNGKVNIVFTQNEGTTTDATLTDVSGRVIKQWKAISGNTMQIDNLQPGVYNFRMVVRETGFQSIAKIIVTGWSK
jgi:hypothetical protein